MSARIRGSFWALLLYDVSERIDLGEARTQLGVVRPEKKPEFRGATPDYVGFASHPVVYEPAAGGVIDRATVHCVVKLYDYGVISVALERPFDCGWDELVTLSNRWIGSAEIERESERIAREELSRVRSTLENPYDAWTAEDYCIVHVREAVDGHGRRPNAKDVITTCGDFVARIVRGESVPLSEGETAEILGKWLSYYPADLAVVGWMAAFVYDTPEGALPMLQLLEHVNTQLLEFRYYDDLLTRVLADVYRRLDHRRGMLGRWRTGREAEALNRVRLDIIELTEQVDNSIKFLSDMFYARAYGLAARRIGVTDYRDLVDEKLRTAGELYESMVSEFHQARAFVLEATVVAILVIELVLLFRGKA
ncbi:MAG TPA: hypothetical protein VG297_24685 [Bryobacteraceae bacterium]|jgi:hypothetical protein|nr:hypothetical protein [Bryobacteraceae bacterium]